MVQPLSQFKSKPPKMLDEHEGEVMQRNYTTMNGKLDQNQAVQKETISFSRSWTLEGERRASYLTFTL